MSGAKNKNPLLGGQREKSGSQTFDKYNYQYHWALFRVLSEHDNVKEYAVFVELHEDVVLTNSLDSTKARFEFNQIKTNNKALTSTDITRKKGDSSILGKIVSNKISKPYSDKIDKLNLVTAKGFSIKLKDPKLELQVISIDDLDDKELEKFKKCLKDELNIDEFPKELRFAKSELSDVQFQSIVIGEISNLITRLYPSSQYNSTSIYQLLFDELKRIGVDTNDYTEWDELLKKKSLTSKQVKEVIESLTSGKNENIINQEFQQICQDLSLNSMQSISLKKDFDRYRQNKFKNKSALQIDIANKISELIAAHETNCNDEISQLIEMVKNDLTDKMKKEFNSENHLKGAIICEYLIR